jgi:calcium-dependent protein kinase
MQRAIKLIKKSLIDPKLGKEGVMAEFKMLKTLDHPNILRVFEAYEDSTYIYIVTELLTGGELFDMLIKEGKFDEEKTAEIARQTLVALAYCHASQLAHRDLKPQNLLIESKEGKIFIKLIDFGLSKFFDKDTIFKEALGTPLFMAPEILKQQPYSYKVDIWSLGIMIFMMLTGKMPFPAKDPKSLFKSIASAHITRSSFDSFSYLSSDAIDFMVCCLESVPEDRWEASKLLDHPWITTNDRVSIPPEITKDIQANLMQFNGKYKLENAVYTYLAMNAATIEDEKYLRELFISMDKSKDGKISMEEFIDGMIKHSKTTYTQVELEEIFIGLDSDKSGNIDYTEFLKAALNKQKLLCETNLQAAFNYFDIDKNGVITKEELLTVFAKGNANLGDDLCDVMIKEIDGNKDQSISFDEFKKMMITGLKGGKI